MVEETWYGANSKKEQRFTYSYDSKGRKIEAHNFGPDNKLYYKYTYKYDDKGNQVEEQRFNSTGELVSVTKSVYNYGQQ
jgi:hypothetical protein